MKHLEELKTVEEKVKHLLIMKPITRNSDKVLIAEYIKEYHKNMAYVPFIDAILLEGMPSFETIRRTRQKIQASNPELEGMEAIEMERREKEWEYETYARGGIDGRKADV